MNALALDELKDALLAAVEGGHPGDDTSRLDGEIATLANALKAAGEHLLRPAVRWRPLGPSPAAPEWVGDYRVLGVLGAGGMGVVYRAEQTRPVRREVAVKVLRSDAASPAAVAGAAAERQALARLGHRNVAVVLDAGVAAWGAPYLVMELAAGPTLCRYADDRGLGLRDRLGLFVAVCRGVHHAHQRGVIHRDVKPGNVLVVEEDGRPVPKVIDFGVAKLVADAAGDPAPAGASLGGLVGTLEYLSPELARDGMAAVDARSDVYGLGAVLFELLTGTPPFDPAALRAGGLSAALTAIGHGPPTRPSRSVSPTGPAAARELAGELDWVVGRATDPDPDRRYASAAALADDVERFLTGRPVEAAPPSRRYLVRKFVRRHVTGVAATAAVGLSLLVGTAVASAGLWQARLDRDRWRVAADEADAAGRQAAAERDRAAAAQREAEQSAELMGEAMLVLNSRDPATRGRLADITRRAEAAVGSASPRTRFRLDLLIGHNHFQAGSLKQAAPALERAHAAAGEDWAEAHERSAAALALSELRVGQGRPADGLALAKEAVGHAERSGRAERAADANYALANALTAAGEWAAAAARLDSLIAAETRRTGEESIAVARCRVLLGKVNSRLGKSAEAEAAAAAGYATFRKLLGMSNPDVLAAGYNLALARTLGGKPAEAVPLLEECRVSGRRALGPDHPSVLSTTTLLARCYGKTGRSDDAVRLFREALADGDRRYGDGNPVGSPAADGLGALLRKSGRHAEAVEVARAGVRYAAARHPGGWQAAASELVLADALLSAGQPAAAAASAEKAHGGLAAGPEEAKPKAKEAARLAAAAFAVAGDAARAGEWRERGK